jgi:sugar lactone lactonase YvrE
VHTILDGGSFFEGPRWHDGRWWVSDFYRHCVLSFDESGADVKQEATVENQPSGLGWTTDGSLLVVSMLDHRLLRKTGDGSLVEVANLSSFAGGPCNDMVVDDAGRAWVGNFGFDYFNGATPKPAVLVRVDPGGNASVAAEDLMFPNGSVVTPGGATLIVGESFGARYTAFTIDPDGALTDRRIWAELPGVAPDGCCLDAEGRIWCADALGGRCVLVEEGGRIVTELKAPEGYGVFACMLGGADEKTLLMCCAPTSSPEEIATSRKAICVTTQVGVPKAGCP